MITDLIFQAHKKRFHQIHFSDIQFVTSVGNNVSFLSLSASSTFQIGVSHFGLSSDLVECPFPMTSFKIIEFAVC